MRISVTPLPTPKMVSMDKLERAMTAALKRTNKQMEKEFKKTTRTWKRKPEMYSTAPTQTPEGLESATGTDNQVYEYVAKGTRPHTIRARRAPMLRFQPGFAAKTIPGLIGSVAGRKFGPFVRVKEVRHPGTKAREFDKRIAAKSEETLALETRVAIMKVVEQTYGR